MKILRVLFSVIMLFAVSSCEKSASPQPAELQWSKSEDPLAKNLGIDNYVLKATPPKDKVFVQRLVANQDGKVSIQEMLSYTGGKPLQASIVVLNPQTFVFATDEMKKSNTIRMRFIINGPNTASLEHILSLGNTSAGGATSWGVMGVSYSFTDSNGKVSTVEFTTKIEDYDIVKKRHPDIFPLSDGASWTFSAFLPAEK